MNEVTIAQQLEAKLNDSSLVVQVVLAAPYIQVVINRTQLPPDYPVLSQQIAQILGQMDLPDMQYVAVYGRVYGQEEVEYETSLEIIKTPVIAPPPTPTHSLPNDNPFLTAASTPAEPEVPVFNLANYCFTRNKALLTSALPSPKMPIAELIRDFDHFADSEKQLILEQLSTFLRNPDGVNTQDWSETMRAWLGRIGKLSDEETRSLAIWISRYCAHPEKTLETVREVFKAAKEAEKERLRQEREARLAERESRTTSGGRTYQSQQTAHNGSRSQLPSRVVSEPVASPVTKVFTLLGLIILTVVVTYVGRAVTFSTSILSVISFILTLLGGWYLSICNEIQFLVLGTMSLKALFIHFIIFIVALIPAVIIYFITLLIMPWIAVAWVGGIAGAIIGSIGRSIVRGLGTPEEYQGMSFARFSGLAKQVLGLSFLGMIVGIALGGLPQLDGFSFGGQDGEKDFTVSRCDVITTRYAQGVTIGELEAIIGKPPSSQTREGFGMVTHLWRYDDIQVYAMSDDINKRSFVLAVECTEPSRESE